MKTLHLGRYVLTATTARMVAEATAITLVLVGDERGLGTASLGVLVAAWTLPQVLTAPLIGGWADRSLRPSLLLAGLIAVGGIGIGAVGAGLGTVPLVALAAVAILISLSEPATMGALSGIATRSARPGTGFEAWDAVSYGAAAIAALAMVSASVAIGDPGTTLVLLVGLAAVAALLVARLPLQAAGEADRGLTRSGPWAAMRVMFDDRDLRSMTVLTTISMSAFGGLALVAVDLAEHHGKDSAAASRLVLAMAIGAVVGSLVWTRVAPPARPLRVALVSVAVVGLAFATSALGSWWVCMGAFLVAGVADAPLLVATFAVRNRRSPAHLRASVYTLSASLKIAATSVGAVTIGVLVGVRAGMSGPLTMTALQLVALGACLAIRRLPVAPPAGSPVAPAGLRAAPAASAGPVPDVHVERSI
jgi:hypothetical protein